MVRINEALMKGIQFVVSNEGKRTAVIIDLKKYGRMWEDFYDVMLAEQRKHEPKESLEIVKKKLIQAGKL